MSTNFLEQIGQRIRRARMKKGYTQKQLAELIEISINSLEKYEMGHTDIPLTKAYKICKILGTCVMCNVFKSDKYLERRKFRG